MIEKLDKFVTDALYYYDLPGLAVSLKINDLEYEKAVGDRDVDTGEKLKTDDIFHMASVSKLFTATAILQLEERGLLSTEDRLIDVLPWIKMDDRRLPEIRIGHMLAHTSGMGDVEDYHWQDPKTDPDALKKYCMSDEVTGMKMLHSPEENKFRYSNTAYELLGCITAEKAGMSFEEYIDENIFKPLGMDASSFLTFKRSGDAMAMPHTKDGDKHIIRQTYYPYNRQHGPSSTLTSNGKDMAKWAFANLTKTILKPETYEKMWKEYAVVPNNGEQMGLGWFMRKQEGHILMGHEGTDDGFRSSFWLCPSLNGYIAVMSNMTGAPVKRINRQILSLVLKEG
ncbi:MAG: serine hydrolase [Eubacteriaceae bacterium]|nr:serine hydrolase [Eubacteriaceae bacterium]